MCFSTAQRVFSTWLTTPSDKRGIPVYVFEVAPLNSKTMSAYAKSSTTTSILSSKTKKSVTDTATTPPRLLRLFALYENLTNFIMPLCSNLRDRPNPDTPISQSNNIVDISGVGLKQFWNLRTHMQDASQLATAHYPETLDRIFVSSPTSLPLTPDSLQTLTPYCQDHRRPLLLPHRLVLDKTLVRPDHDLQNLRPGPARSLPNPLDLHRPDQHPQEIRRPTRLRLRHAAHPRSRRRTAHHLDVPRPRPLEPQMAHGTHALDTG